jgi:uncharacterized protein involved in exopolysaccharide biosynthesis
MAFAPFVDALRRGWIFVLASSLLLGMIGFVGAVHVKPTYTAKAWVVPALVEKLPPPPERSTGGMAATIFINTRIREYTAAADTEAFAERVVDIYGLPLNPTDL